MTNLLIKLFIKNPDNTSDRAVRRSYIVLGSIVGIACNIILFIVKLLVGILSGSIAIMADAFNNLSDLGSSAVTFIGFKMSEKPADKEHPFGHGRIEYMSALVVSALIIVVGAELLKGSIKKIFNPENLSVSGLTIAILTISILIKLWMFLFNRKVGKKIRSEALVATAQDSLNDSIATSAVLISVIISLLTNFNIDPYMGILVALFIIFSGVKTIKETLDPLLGMPPDPETIEQLVQLVLSFDEFIGIHDLIVHNYGPGRSFASIHVEVAKDSDIVKCHEKIDMCERLVAERMGLELVIHMDPVVTDDKITKEIKDAVLKKVQSINTGLSIHDFRIVEGEEHTNLIFDVVVPPDFKIDDTALTNKIKELCKEIDPTYMAVVCIDKNYSAL